ncbi:hypothetical protein VB712_10770 [Spirulina sp. CCNP1310]|uniref:hypothetical protein n=1 Tax=Spirulina sp. CCNP1310 TaxID=3110249 RepID=UPI002B214C51|nr:hypothetical protein [Spirulina sp. CCNP1310]MEA5419705.1 hypothetical protein [Spirulina sp. CCNP1310]
MTTEELLIAKWRNLSPDKQQEAIAFVDCLSRPNTDSPLGQKLRAIRAKILESGIPLLTDRELEQEIRERRGDREASY